MARNKDKQPPKGGGARKRRLKAPERIREVRGKLRWDGDLETMRRDRPESTAETRR